MSQARDDYSRYRGRLKLLEQMYSILGAEGSDRLPVKHQYIRGPGQYVFPRVALQGVVELQYALSALLVFIRDYREGRRFRKASLGIKERCFEEVKSLATRETEKFLTYWGWGRECNVNCKVEKSDDPRIEYKGKWSNNKVHLKTSWAFRVGRPELFDRSGRSRKFLVLDASYLSESDGIKTYSGKVAIKTKGQVIKEEDGWFIAKDLETGIVEVADSEERARKKCLGVSRKIIKEKLKEVAGE